MFGATGFRRTAGRGRGLLLLQIAALTLLYVAFGWIDAMLGWREGVGFVTRTPSGIALAALILFGPRLWPGVFIGSLVSCMLDGLPLPNSLAGATANTLAPWVGAQLLCRYLRFRPSLERVRDVGLLFLVGGAFASAIGAVASVASMSFAATLDGSDVFSHVGHAWRAEFARVLVFTPLFLVIRHGNPPWRELFSRTEFWLVAALLVASCHLAFFVRVAGEFQSLVTHLPLLLVLWAGARLGIRGAVLATFSTLILVGNATTRGFGPYVTDDPATTFSLVWIYMVFIASIGPLLAAAVAQRNQALAESFRERAGRIQVERDRQLLQERQIIMREMHDGLGGQLVSVLSMVRNGEASRDEIAEGLRRALDDMRIMIDAFERGHEDLSTLLGKLRARLEPLLRRNGLELDWWVDPAVPLELVDSERSLHCLRIIQAAVTNVIQHARASRVAVTIAAIGSDAKRLSIEVSDDGIGDSPDVLQRGHGIRNMLKRAGEIGGEIRFEATNPGTRVRLVMPIPAPAQ